MAMLLILPVELLEQVLVPCSISTLSRLSRTNKALYEYLTPRVYNSINWHWEDGKPAPPIDLLLQTLLWNPFRAKHIKSLRLRGGGITLQREWENWCPDEDEMMPRPFEYERSLRNIVFSLDDIEKVICLVHNIYRPPPTTWVSEISRGGVDASIALLLSCLSSLEHLDLGFGYLYRSHFLPAILRHNALNQGFPKLKKLDFGLDAPISCIHFGLADIDLLRPLFFLPSLGSINTISPEPVVFAWPSVAPRTSCLSTLILRKSSIEEKALGQLLSCTSGLRHLTYDHRRPADWGWPGDGRLIQIRCRLLNKALSHIRTTLESLVIRIDFENYGGGYPPHQSDYEGPCGVSGRLTVLHSMLKLTILEAPWVLLHGMDIHFPSSWVDTLPKALRKLCLRDDIYETMDLSLLHSVTVDRISQLLCLAKRFFPNLRHISFTYFADDEYLQNWYGRNKVMLHDLCTTENIGCEIEREERF